MATPKTFAKIRGAKLETVTQAETKRNILDLEDVSGSHDDSLELSLIKQLMLKVDAIIAEVAELKGE